MTYSSTESRRIVDILVFAAVMREASYVGVDL